jgi:muramoyltetrapeptide carboxypeptidase
MPLTDVLPVRPLALRPGDRVAVVSPSGPSPRDRVADGVELLTGWGLEVSVGPDVFARHGFLGGTDAQRRDHLNAAWRDPSVRAVICARGGYGAQRIVDELDIGAVRADPKLFVGFSDITALHLALWRGARLATVHGPGAAWRHARTPEASAEALRRALMTTEDVLLRPDPEVETSTLRLGTAAAQGLLLGGNLSLLAASAGTPDALDLHGALLLVEDVAEAPYRVDRMLTQLERSGALDGVAGVVVGDFVECADEDGGPDVVTVLGERLGRLGVPVVGGYRLGHGHGQLPVPLGVPATLDPVTGVLTVTPAVC